MKNPAKPLTPSLIEDLHFALLYSPRGLSILSTYCLVGALGGWCSTYTCKKAWDSFAAEHHHTLDPSGVYVAEDLKYMKFSRHQVFNQQTPAISDAIPVYAAILGAGAAGFFAANKIVIEFKTELNKDRKLRQENFHSV